MERNEHNDELVWESQRLLGDLARRWKQRRENMGLKPGTIKHARAQLEFFIGACTMYQIERDDEKATPFSPMVMVLMTHGTDSYAQWGHL
jgi:hypothetical protein